MPKQGTIVLVPFPFTDLSGAKVRPALVISTEAMKLDIILAFISSKQKQGQYNVSVTPSKLNGLKASSTITCNKVATLERTVMLGEIGNVEKEVLAQVKSTLGIIFGL